jgi:hypothetical protein
MKENLNAYHIYWVEFIPEFGKVTAHDLRAFGYNFCHRKEATYKKPFASKEAAVEFIQTFGKKLDKRYMCLLSTDKQFAMATESNGYAIPYTEKQKQEAYYI